MEDKKVFETYNKLVPVIEDVAIGNPIKDADLQVFTGAALMKCLEFNLTSFNETSTNATFAAFFISSGLRGLCEDFITLKYFKEIIDPQDAQKILMAWPMKQMAEGIEKQNLFFQINRPQQPVISYSDHFQKILISSNAALKTYRSKYGWTRNLPKVIEMADACSVRPLYDYLYHATSKSVHFSPHLAGSGQALARGCSYLPRGFIGVWPPFWRARPLQGLLSNGKKNRDKHLSASRSKKLTVLAQLVTCGRKN